MQREKQHDENWICYCLNSGLICKVSAGNENAFQTTSYLSALSSREHLLLPLVLGLRRWAQVCFQLRPWPVAHISKASSKEFFVFFNMLFLLVFLDLCDRPCRGRWAATVCLRPHGYLLLTAAQRVSFAYLPERGVFFSFISAWNKIYDISIGCFVSCFQLKLIQSSVFL